ncbi:hypothetical protein Acr_00g0076720 [Actinidia rufa]|uniref:Uncharacterized protein n=1 Tax=Actinidia rufa TaxID=165716 RepID=A0A7J0DUD4_9ERIC|nr:hypothetical protein Acr_00g0076720 [Actinidia rufa]
MFTKGTWVNLSSDSVRSSPPKNGCIAITPAILSLLKPPSEAADRSATWWAMLPPALSPVTKQRLRLALGGKKSLSRNFKVSKAVFRGEAVIDGYDDGGDVFGEAAAEFVVGFGACGEEHEAAAVEVDDDGEHVGVGGGEEAEPEVASDVDGDVGEGDAVHWFGGRRGFGVEEVHETDCAVGAAGVVNGEGVASD